MFAILGEILFELLTSPGSIESDRTWDFAEHRVVEGRPTQQWIATGLENVTMDFHFHSSFTNPAIQYAALVAAAEDHNARALVFGNGVHRGYFIITALRTTTQQMSATGELTDITVQTRLREWVFESEANLSGPPIPWFPLIGIATASSFTSTSLLPPTGSMSLTMTRGTSVLSVLSIFPSAPGVSPMLRLSAVAGLTAPRLSPDDVSPGFIVRAPR